MNTGPYIREANAILRELDGVFPGGDGVHPLFQLRWSESLWSYVPQYQILNDEPIPILEFRCRCGIDKRVHEPACNGLTVAKIKVQKVPTFGLEGEFQSYVNVWVLCKWNAPPGLDAWVSSMGTDEDYPANGRYLPIHRGPHCVVIPRNVAPDQYPECARRMVYLMREHRAKWLDELKEKRERDRALKMPVIDPRGNIVAEPDRSMPYHRVKDQLKEKMRHFNPAGTVGYTKEIVNE